MTNVIHKIAETCSRKDCQFSFDEGGITNMAGHTTGVTCYTCKREWSLHKPARIGPIIYDRNGAKISDPELAIQITERRPRQ